MTPTSSGKPRPPGLDIKGPTAHVPAVGGPGALPYAASRPRWGLVAGGAAVLVAVVVVGLVVALSGGSEEDRAAGPATAPAERSSTTSEAATTTAPATTSSTAVPSSTTTAPATTTTVSPTAAIPVDALPRHEAVYRDGKLVLQGTVPSAAVRERFREEAAAVIGGENVIVRYVIDPRVPEPTDGRVRVDEDFLFQKNSAAIDPRYKALMDLGVTVMRINPQARMRIVGHTDDSGSLALNQALSRERAEALRGYLIDNGIGPERVEAIGLGPAAPVAPNDNEGNRARNRRIEVELLNLLAG